MGFSLTKVPALDGPGPEYSLRMDFVVYYYYIIIIFNVLKEAREGKNEEKIKGYSESYVFQFLVSIMIDFLLIISVEWRFLEVKIPRK